MKHHGYRLVLCLLTVLASGLLGSRTASAGVSVAPVTTITGEEAAQHLQETNTVCGLIASAKYVKNAKDNPTYLNFDRPFPRQPFAAVVAESARAKFKVAPETAFMGKHVCITGFITTNSHGRPEMAVTDPSQITIDESAPAAATASPPGASVVTVPPDANAAK